MVGAHIDVPMGTPMGDVPSFHQNIVQKIYIQDPPGLTLFVSSIGWS